ncbi:MAG: hypothetical protein H6Q69_3885 [Firmicutes bacterium]|nr:hypothetical protein [Bacillota bacterium]
MECFDLKSYEPYFHKERVEITRWDSIDDNVIRYMFYQEPLRSAAESFVSYFGNVFEGDERYKKIGRFFYPAGNFDAMLSFLRYAVSQKDCNTEIICLTRIFAQDNCYNEPSWILWGRFLNDVLDMLKQWKGYDDKAVEHIVEHSIIKTVKK